jgi:hypothetical protein
MPINLNTNTTPVTAYDKVTEFAGIQRPATMLTVKKSMGNIRSGVTAGSIPEKAELILMTDDAGDINGEIRIGTGNRGAVYYTTGVADNSLSGEEEFYPLTSSGDPINNNTLPLYQVGALIYFAGPEPPVGYLFCNGGVYESALYPELATFLGKEFEVSATQFRVPDYTNTMGQEGSRYQGGLFIRLLNQGGPTVANNNPDYIDTILDVNQYGDYLPHSGNTFVVDRQYGSIQQESYISHNHKLLTTNVSDTEESHSHRYFGAYGATDGYYLGRIDGEQAISGDGYKISERDPITSFIIYSGLATTDQGGAPGAQDFFVGSSEAFKPNPTYDTQSYNFPVDLGLLASKYPMEGVSPGQDMQIGDHLHSGWIGHGPSLTDNTHNTIHYTTTTTGNTWSNQGETQPRNYSVLFCIKY